MRGGIGASEVSKVTRQFKELRAAQMNSAARLSMRAWFNLCSRSPNVPSFVLARYAFLCHFQRGLLLSRLLRFYAGAIRTFSKYRLRLSLSTVKVNCI